MFLLVQITGITSGNNQTIQVADAVANMFCPASFLGLQKSGG